MTIVVWKPIFTNIIEKEEENVKKYIVALSKQLEGGGVSLGAFGR